MEEELRLFLKKEEAESPVDILRTYRLIDVEDEIIEQGFSELLELAYGGSLTVDEYVLFIENSFYARTFEVDIPGIDWKKVKEGINIQFKNMLDPDYEDNHFHRMIGSENSKYYTKDEWSAYQAITDFREQDKLVYEKNRRLYIDSLSNNLNQAFEQLGGRKYNALTSEMEIATYNAYRNAQNIDKKSFPGWFSRIWINFRNTQGMDVHLTEKSLKKLSEDLKILKCDYEEKKKKIAAGLTQNFIGEIDKILGV